MSRRVLAGAWCALAVLAGCRRNVPAGAIDPALAACIPPGTIALAGLNAEQMRHSALAAEVPLLEPFRDARAVLAAYTSQGVLIAVRRQAGAPPEVNGPADLVEQAKKGGGGAPDLLADAEQVAGANEIWAVVRGNVTLPLTGNAANVNRLLRNMEFAAVTLREQSDVEIALRARGVTAEAARHFEETLRATLTMTAAAEAKDAEIATLLRSITLQREDRTVRATLKTDTAKAGALIQRLVKP